MFLEYILWCGRLNSFFGGSNLWAGFLLANLLVRMIDSVYKVGLNVVLFFFTTENNVSSSALEWGSTKINFVMDDK